MTTAAVRRCAAILLGTATIAVTSWGGTTPTLVSSLSEVSEALNRRIAADSSGWRSMGEGGGVVDVRLRADASDLADSIIREFGSLVSVRLGNFPYPDRGTGLVTDVCVNHLSEAVTSVRGLEATLQLASSTVHPGADFLGSVVVHNDSDTPVSEESEQPIIALVLRSGTQEVLAQYEGGIAGTGLLLDLGVGDDTKIDMWGSTASCDPGLGWALPRGAYDVVAVVPLYRQEGDTARADYLVTPPVPLVLA